MHDLYTHSDRYGPILMETAAFFFYKNMFYVLMEWSTDVHLCQQIHYSNQPHHPVMHLHSGSLKSGFLVATIVKL